jgi:SAM-dependent methyltransferase
MGLMKTLKQHAAAIRLAAPQAPVSTEYRIVPEAAISGVSHALRDAWKSPDIPVKQRAVADPQLRAYRAGSPMPAFDAIVDILVSNITDLSGLRLLEIGCSSGYYSEVFAIKKLGLLYEGCDYGPAFIDLARKLYPATPFEVQEATKLDYVDASFDIVVSGCCILHIPHYERAISEAARVARQWVVFHRTPVLHLHDSVVYTKLAYGTKTIEIHFNEQSLLRLFTAHNLRVVDANTHAIDWDLDKKDALAMKTYLCEKRF